MPEQEGGTESGEKAFIPVESVVFELNGTRYRSGTDNGKNDTISLQEEGVRVFKIVEYEPADAYPVPSVADINFYQEIYAFNFAMDSIVTLGGEYAKPVNHYLNFTEGDFLLLAGMTLPETDTVKFYNRVNRANDMSVVETDGAMQMILWESLGKLRRYRIAVNVVQQRENINDRHTFTLPFYEKTNKVEILGFPHEASPYIELFPGDSLQLKFRASAPEEFTRYEWTKGNANERFEILNREQIGKLYMAELQNPLLTEGGKRYTDSMISLDINGMLRVDKNWDMAQAASNGGHIYNEVPVCIIMMPHQNSDEDAAQNMATPFYSNAVVKIVSQ